MSSVVERGCRVEEHGQMEAAIEQTTYRSKRRHGRKLVVLVVLVVALFLGGRWFWRQVQFTRLRSPLIEAVKAGNAARVRDLLEQGVDPNTRVDYKAEPFTWASVLRILRGRKSVTPSRGATVLISAVAKNRANIVRMLLEHGADVRLKDKEGEAAINTAAFGALDCTKVLVAYGADINGKGSYGYTPLHSAILWEALDTAPSRAGIRAQVPNGASCIDFLLQQGADMNVQDDDGDTALMFATAWPSDRDPSPLLRRLLKQGLPLEVRDREGKTALIRAAGAGRPEPVRILLDHGAAIDVQDKEGTTALMDAVKKTIPAGSRDMWSGTRADHLSTIRLLIDRGADLNRKDREGRIALRFAEMWMDRETISLLRNAAARAPRPGKSAGR